MIKLSEGNDRNIAPKCLRRKQSDVRRFVFPEGPLVGLLRENTFSDAESTD